MTLIPVNAAKIAAEIAVAGEKENTFFQMNFLSCRFESLNDFISDYLIAFK
jgi:hypothetical protein